MVALRDDLERGAVGRRRPRRAAGLRLIQGGALPLVRRDTLPEHAEYRDTGCALSPRCLSCTVERCKDDEPDAAAKVRARDREIVMLRRRHCAPINALAGTYGLTRRSIFRILRDART
jgi:hypothetical protein